VAVIVRHRNSACESRRPMRWHEWHVCEVDAGFTTLDRNTCSVALSSMAFCSGERPRVKPTVHASRSLDDGCTTSPPSPTPDFQTVWRTRRLPETLSTMSVRANVVVEPFVGTPLRSVTSCSRFLDARRRSFVLLPLHTNVSVGEPSLRAQPVMRAVSPMSADVRRHRPPLIVFQRALDGDV